MRISLLIAAVVAATLFVKPAQAAITINMQEKDGDVIFSYSGSLDITGLTSAGQNQIDISAVWPIVNLIYFSFPDPPFVPVVDVYIDQLLVSGSLLALGRIGDGGSTDADSVTGDGFLLQGRIFAVPTGYVSGDYIEGTMTFESADFDTLGIDAVSAPYVWTVQNSAADTITLQVIPEPTSALFLCGTGALACLRRRKRVA